MRLKKLWDRVTGGSDDSSPKSSGAEPAQRDDTGGSRSPTAGDGRRDGGDVRGRYFREIDQARREWQAAKARFEHVSDPALVDHAAHLITAAEKRYVYLLREARQRGIHVEDTLPGPVRQRHTSAR